MKKRISMLLVVVLIVSAVCITGASAAADTTEAPSVRVNDLLVSFPDTQPYIDSNDRTMIPVRFVTEALGATVTWDQDTQTATIALDGTTVKVPIGSKTITVTKDGNTSTVTMDTQAVITDGRTCIPIRFVAEALGAYVGWSNYYNTVVICKENLTSDEITRLRAYGYCFYGGGRYYYNSDGELCVTTSGVKYYDTEASAAFLDENYGYDNAREFLLRYKRTTGSTINGALTGTSWLNTDDNQARLYMNEAVALVNEYWSCDGLTASFRTDTSCMYQDDYYDGFHYSSRGILELTVTDTDSEEMQTTLSDLGVTYVSDQTSYAVDFEAKVYNRNSTVYLNKCYNLETCFN